MLTAETHIQTGRPSRYLVQRSCGPLECRNAAFTASNCPEWRP
jgi:hypothetical protein